MDPEQIAQEFSDELAVLSDEIGDAWRALARAGVYQVRPDMTLADGIAELAADVFSVEGEQLPLLGEA
jgi:hypothetical protein